MLNLEAGPTLRFWISGNGTNTFSVSSSVIPVAGRWYHVIGQYLASTPEIKICVNGTNWNSNAAGIPAAPIYDSNSRLEFGASEAGASNRLAGRIAYAWIGSQNLTPLFVQTLYEHTRPLFGL
jgi:hypothetical protein